MLLCYFFFFKQKSAYEMRISDWSSYVCSSDLTLVAAYLERLGEIDIWMTPTFSSEIVRIGVFGPDVAWDDQKDHLVDYAGYCWIDNFAGTPSISLPMGFSDNGLPVGVQFATKPGDEARLLSPASQPEAAVD